MASVEEHGDRFRVVWRADGKKRRRSFKTKTRRGRSQPIRSTLSGSNSIGITPHPVGDDGRADPDRARPDRAGRLAPVTTGRGASSGPRHGHGARPRACR